MEFEYVNDHLHIQIPYNVFVYIYITRVLYYSIFIGYKPATTIDFVRPLLLITYGLVYVS